MTMQALSRMFVLGVWKYTGQYILVHTKYVLLEVVVIVRSTAPRVIMYHVRYVSNTHPSAALRGSHGKRR